MKRKIAYLITTSALIMGAFFIGRLSMLPNVIPVEDLYGYFYDSDDYLCFELGDYGNQYDNPNGISYDSICEKLPHLTELEKDKYDFMDLNDVESVKETDGTVVIETGEDCYIFTLDK